jgi:SAM-dependent methyltransferase
MATDGQAGGAIGPLQPRSSGWNDAAMSAPDPAAWRTQVATNPVDPAVRRAFLDARRRSHAERLTALGPHDDADWGAISPSHARFLEALLERTRHGAVLLDVACGTGKYWPAILAAGRHVVGVDQAPGMLEEARRKHPAVPSGLIAMADLRYESAFSGVLCVDALENVGPEDWPRTLARIVAAARHGSTLWMTVELAEDEVALERSWWAASAAGHPVVPGEDFDGTGYHYFPTDAELDDWLEDISVDRLATEDADGYRHLLLRRPAA